MKQVWQILRKDVRLFWIEIAATVVTTGLFAYLYPMGWAGWNTLHVWPWVPSTAGALMVLSWLVLITRVIHGDSLVGERQFWITRPMRWPELLTAKAVLIGVTIFVPYVAAQCVLLLEAGMQPSSYLYGLGFHVLYVVVMAVLPMACLAAVTGHFGKTLLGLLGVALFAASVGFLSDVVPTSSSESSGADVASFVVAMSVFVAILVIQYARRATAVSWGLLCALGVTIAACGLLAPWSAGTRSAYAATAPGVGPHLDFGQMPTGVFDRDSAGGNSREITAAFPVAIAGIDPKTAMRADVGQVTISDGKGLWWRSHWQDLRETWLPGDATGSVSLKISRSFYERVKDHPVTVELAVGVSVLQAGKAEHLVISAGRVSMPGGGECEVTHSGQARLSCLWPMRDPPLMLIAARFSTLACVAGGAVTNDGEVARDWIGSLDWQPADVGLTPVVSSEIWFGLRTEGDQYLCDGLPVTVVPYTQGPKRMQEMRSERVDLAKFVG